MKQQTRRRLGSLVYNEMIAPIVGLEFSGGRLVVVADATAWLPGFETDSVFKIFGSDGEMVCEVGPVGPRIVIPDETVGGSRLIRQEIIFDYATT